MLLNAANLPDSLGGAFRRCLRRLAAACGSARATPLDTAALRDLGLSRSDLPAIATGRLATDPTRRAR